VDFPTATNIYAYAATSPKVKNGTCRARPPRIQESHDLLPIVIYSYIAHIIALVLLVPEQQDCLWGYLRGLLIEDILNMPEIPIIEMSSDLFDAD
jgi:hypothetical protein